MTYSAGRQADAASTQALVVEADMDLARDLTARVERLGYGVCAVADSLIKAVSVAKKLNPDVVLMDGRLAVGEGSVSNFEPLIPRFSMPVIMMIAPSDHGDFQRVANSARHGYLVVPFQSRELRAAIEVALYKGKLERRLRDSERWFVDTLHCVTDGVIAVDIDGGVCFLNLVAEQILGVSLELIQNKKIEEILHFEDTNVMSAADVLRSGSTFGIDFGKWIVNGKGDHQPVDHSAAPIRDENDKLMGAVVVIRDASTRIAAEEALRFSEDRFRTAFENAPEGMALVTMDGRFVQGNPAVCTLLRCNEVELQSLNLSDITPPEEHVTERQRLTRLIIGSESSLQYERKTLPRHGEPLWVQVTVSLLQREGFAFCYLYQFHDLTAKKMAASLEIQRQTMSKIHESTLQEKRIAQDANQSKTAFISSMSHELRTPLNAILGFSQLLENETSYGLTSGQHDFVQNIQRAGWHLLDLINDILDLGKIESGTLRLSIEDVDLQELLPDCIQFISTKADESHVAVNVDGSFDFIVRADRIRLRQVILNFLSNAVKYNSEGGSVTVACSLHGDRVRIAVSDTGPGLSDEQKSHLFEPFNRLGKEGGAVEGSGIGLVITKRLVESMGGAIGVEGRVESGCVFWVDLLQGHRSYKVAEENLERSTPKISTSNSPTQRSTILCIEDNPVNMLLVSRIVQQRSDWILITAATGEEGFNQAVKLTPDLILLDISLPDVSGLELIERLRSNVHTRMIPIAAVSANAGPQYIREALARGFDRYITKPIRVPEFLQTVEMLLNEKYLIK